MKHFIPLFVLCTIFPSIHSKTCASYPISNTPQITIAIVIDQFAYAYIPKLKAYFTDGLKTLLNNGIVYTNAHTPYAWPATAPGHTALNTGVVPRDHGIINNDWALPNGKLMACDEDTVENAAVFGPNGLLDYGRSSRHIMVDGISDQLILQTKQDAKYKVFSISEKSRAAICTAGHLGKAIWLDEKNCMFTSSKAYFETLPAWLKQFNEKKKLKTVSYTWKLSKPNLPAAYRFKHAHDYTNAADKTSKIGKTYRLCGKDQTFMQTPFINQLVFDTALACIDAHLCKDNPQEKLFLWILPSALDLIGHDFGPNTIEAIDVIYHLDQQIGRFIKCVNQRTRASNVLWALTADHGVTPIAEQIKSDGYSPALRIPAQALTTKINDHLKEMFDQENIVTLIKGNNLSVDEKLFKSFDKSIQQNITRAIKKFISRQPGIKQVWTFKELETGCTHEHSLVDNYKNMLFKGRSPRFFIQPFPYVYISTKTIGTNHQTPYNPDTHIPLILYQSGNHQRKIIDDRVYNTQLAPTLAHILGTPRPSACTADILPGVTPAVCR